MEGRVLGLLAAFLFIVCFAGYISFSGELDSKRRDLQEASALLQSTKQGLDARLILLDTTKKELSAIQQQTENVSNQTDNINSLTKNKQLLINKISELGEGRKKLLKDFSDQVQKVRTNSEGMELATVKLSSGQLLQGVKIQKISDATVSLSHSTGIIKVDGKDLPEDLRERFRYGMEPSIIIAVEAPVEKKDATVASSMTIPSSSPTPQSLTSANHYQIEIDGIDQRIDQLEKSKLEWATQADAYRSQARSAQNLGRPSYTFKAQAAQADQNIQLINAQIGKLQAEQVELRKKMVSAMSIPAAP